MSDTTTQEPQLETPMLETSQPVNGTASATPKETSAAASEIAFLDLPLSEEVLESVLKAGYEKPTPIQAQIIPHMLEGRDVLAQSQTGTGKTAAFALPILSRIDIQKRKPQVLVLAPTRELAIQVAKSFETYGSRLGGLNVATIYGGQNYDVQFRQLRRGAHVVVGTPGRIIDHIKRESLDLGSIECLVLDEADEMLNMGFLEDVQFVLKQTPAKRQIALFSATLPGPIREISKQYLHDPARITIEKKTMTADSIRQRAVFLAPRDKMDVLTRFVETEETDGVIVFTKTKDATISVAEKLNRCGLAAVALNGDMPQTVRERAINQIRNGHLDILVATDVAARGLDLTRVSHVFNFDLPHDSESYIHRIGRTGRAGRKGEAIIFLTGSQRGKLRMIERATRQTIEIVEPPSTDEINAMRVKRFQKRITAVIAEQNLTMFKEMIAGYAAESGKPMDSIAAALAHMGQNGRPFLMTDRPRPKRHERSEDRHERNGNNKGYDRGGKNPPRKRERKLGPPVAGMSRYRIDVGWRDGVKPGNIVGAVANEAGIDGEYIGPISIHDAYTTIDLPEGMPNEIYQTLRKTWVSGKQLRLRLDSDKEAHDSERKSGGGKSKTTHGKKKFSRARPLESKSAKGRFSNGKSAKGKPAHFKSKSKSTAKGKSSPGGKSKKTKAGP